MINVIKILIFLFAGSFLFSYGDRRNDIYTILDSSFVDLSAIYWEKKIGKWEPSVANSNFLIGYIKETPNIVFLLKNGKVIFADRSKLNSVGLLRNVLNHIEIPVIMVKSGIYNAKDMDAALYELYNKYAEKDKINPEISNIKITYYYYKDVVQYYIDYQEENSSCRTDLFSGESLVCKEPVNNDSGIDIVYDIELGNSVVFGDKDASVTMIKWTDFQ